MNEENAAWLKRVSDYVYRILGDEVARPLGGEIEQAVNAITHAGDDRVRKLGPAFYAGRVIWYLDGVEYDDTVDEKVAALMKEQ